MLKVFFPWRLQGLLLLVVELRLQIAEQLQLTPSILLTELANGKINFSDANRTLRENFPHNDEKIFAAITIDLKVRFNPTLL